MDKGDVWRRGTEEETGEERERSPCGGRLMQTELTHLAKEEEGDLPLEVTQSPSAE